MGNLTDVRMPLPQEHNEIKGAAVVSAAALIGVLALAGFLLVRSNHSAGTTASNYQAAVIGDPKIDSSVAKAAPESKVAAKTPEMRGQASTFLDVVRATSAHAFVGKVVKFEGVNVMNRPAANIFCVGPNEQDCVLVHLVPGADTSKLGDAAKQATGQTVTIVGQVMLMPTEETKRRWGLRAEDEAKIGHRAVYIKATSIEDATH